MPNTYIPAGSLVICAGPPASGKSTVARGWGRAFWSPFYPHALIVSSDAIRERLFGDEAVQGLTGPAHDAVFGIAHAEIAAGLSQGQTVVFDATNLTPAANKRPLDIAAEYGADVYVVLFDQWTEDEMRVLNRHRTRQVPDAVLDKAFARWRSALGNKATVWPGVTAFVSMKQHETDGSFVALDETGWHRPGRSGRLVSGFDVVGDIHGCSHTYQTLAERAGYDPITLAPTQHDRMLVSVGDVVDRGPQSIDMLDVWSNAVTRGRALMVKGNHEAKLGRYLRKMLAADDPEAIVANLARQQGAAHGLTATLTDMLAVSPARWSVYARFIERLPTHLVLDSGRLAVVHGAIRPSLFGQTGPHADAWFLYGAPTGAKTDDGLPVRSDWQTVWDSERLDADLYPDGWRPSMPTPFVVAGHSAFSTPKWSTGSVIIDTGAGKGDHHLSMLRWDNGGDETIGPVDVIVEPIDERDIVTHTDIDTRWG